MQVSIETINGKKCTVIHHGDDPLPNYLGLRHVKLCDGSLAICRDLSCTDHIATALPALPRHPKPEHAKLLYRYMAEGLYPAETYGNHCVGVCRNASQSCDSERMRITHCVTETGQRVDVAIDG